MAAARPFTSSLCSVRYVGFQYCGTDWPLTDPQRATTSQIHPGLPLVELIWTVAVLPIAR